MFIVSRCTLKMEYDVIRFEESNAHKTKIIIHEKRNIQTRKCMALRSEVLHIIWQAHFNELNCLYTCTNEWIGSFNINNNYILIRLIEVILWETSQHLRVQKLHIIFNFLIWQNLVIELVTIWCFNCINYQKIAEIWVQLS